ncbi:DEAD/DEAH box helicase [Candidatus Woesearchaeota archaeon]|nr:DEAD/DEAH box helicase [Candidatus Woesearchaeota archaeon]
MTLQSLKQRIPKDLYNVLEKDGITHLRPAQRKAIKAGLLEGKNVLVCTPTASGKTLIAELASVSSIMERRGKCIYIVPLKSLATEKYNEFRKKYEGFFKVALSIGDIDSADPYLKDYDFIISTSEKVDSLIRHRADWLREIKTVVVDEIHLMNDPGRGPTLEILITLLRQLLKNVQILGLSATIGNPEELAEWLDAGLVIDYWRPVELKKGVYMDGEIEFTG